MEWRINRFTNGYILFCYEGICETRPGKISNRNAPCKSSYDGTMFRGVKTFTQIIEQEFSNLKLNFDVKLNMSTFFVKTSGSRRLIGKFIAQFCQVGINCVLYDNKYTSQIKLLVMFYLFMV